MRALFMTPRHGVVLGIIVALVLALVGCDSLPETSDVDAGEILSVTVGESLLADGTSTLGIEARIPPDADDDKRTVTFRTDLGTFVGTDNETEVDVPADRSGSATAQLKAGTTPGTATVTATVADYVVTSRVQLQRALADTLQCQTSTGVAKLDGTSNPLITALLRREVGSVSVGTQVLFDAIQADANGVERSVGRWTGLEGSTTNASGNATASLAVDTGDVLADSPLTVVVTTQGAAGSSLQCTIVLRVE